MPLKVRELRETLAQLTREQADQIPS